MTLAEFCIENSIKAGTHDRAPLARVIPNTGYPNHEDLWNLSDYVVSSCIGGSIWLIPRNAY